MSEKIKLATKPVIVIVGGGFSGTMTAVNLLRQQAVSLDIILIEPREQPGLGLAYSTPCPDHLLNVRASGMSAFVEEPDHFFNHAKKLDKTVTKNTFVPRKKFGQYIVGLLQAAQAAGNENVSFRHVQATAVDLEKNVQNKYGDFTNFTVYLKNGEKITASVVLLAMGNLSAQKPRWALALGEHSQHYIHDPWDREELEHIGLQETVLIVGTGLTAIDKLVQLDLAGHTGPIYAVSRHGLFPRPHTVEPSELHEKTPLQTEATREAFGKVKSLSVKAKDWRTVIDGLRAITQSWWSSLDSLEQKRFLRHVQTYWDVHRHRMAPEIADRVQKMQYKGQLQLIACRLKSFAEKNRRIEVTLKKRHCESDSLETTDTVILVDKIINCTGPQSKLDTVDSDLLHNLKKRGLVCNHRLGSGIECKNNGEIVDESGNAQETFLAIGPMLKAQLLESVAVPELKVQAKATADAICQLVKAQSSCSV